MTKYIQVFILFLTFSAYGQHAIQMETPENTNEKFAEFIAKKKFIKENYYTGIPDKKIQLLSTENINQVATDFRAVATSEKPTDKKYQEKIKIGLLRFSSFYLELDTEDRERVCTYFEELMDIVGLESSNGQLNTFMYGFDPNKPKKNH
ncbi:DUF4844 domain-containing protein [Dokdonia sp.]|uniref:DUF4844 domain-containing protein n=1 Tax=Dokdonia sp. TaxID=2024995 RepID=UPI00326423EC